MHPTDRIDHRDQLRRPLEQYTYENLRMHYGTGQAFTEGSGRYKKHGYRSGVQTGIGDIEERLWIEIAEELIALKGDAELLAAFNEFFETDTATSNWKRKEKKIRALDAVLSGLQDSKSWVAYVPFNQKYRPEAIDPQDLVMVVNECCQKPGWVTRQQIQKRIEFGTPDQVACPICGRLSRYRRQEDHQ